MSKEKLKAATRKMSHALSADPDCVKVRIREFDFLLRESVEGVQYSNEGSVWLDQAQLEAIRTVTSNGQLVFAADQRVADTSAMHSKKQERGVEDKFLGYAAFALAKDGTLYVEEWGKKIAGMGKGLVHGSFQNDAPLEMAGLVRIQDGKISAMNDHSGHYAPEPLDMYRGIKALAQSHPGIMHPNAKISFHMGAWNKQSMHVDDFMRQMEGGVPPLHQKLRDARVAKYAQEAREIKNARTVTMDMTDKSLLAALQESSKGNAGFARLAKALQSPLSQYHIKTKEGTARLTYGKFIETIIKDQDAAKIVDMLLKAGLNPNQLTSRKANSNVEPAPDKMGTEYAKALRESGKVSKHSAKATDKVDGKTLLMQAIEKGQTDVALRLAGNKKTNLGLKDSNGKSAFDYAMEAGNLEVIRAFAARGINLNQPNDQGLPPLHTVIAGNNNALLGILLDHGADINVQANRESALTCALRVGNKQAVNLLLGKGVVLNGRAECGAILQQIVKNYSAEFAQQFFARPDWEVDSHSLANAMELSLTLGDHEMAGFLLRKGANPNRLDKDNMTPLLRLTERGDLGAVETLLKYAQNLDLSATDEQGNTALRIAQYNFHHPEMANLISAYIPKMAAVELTKDITPVQDILHAKDTPDKLAGLQADQAVLKVASLLSSSGMAANADIDESSQVLSPPVTSPQISTQLAKEAAAITKGSAKRKDSGIVESDDYVAPPSGSPGTSPLRRGRS